MSPARPPGPCKGPLHDPGAHSLPEGPGRRPEGAPVKRLRGLMAAAVAVTMALLGPVSAAEPCPPQPAPLTPAAVEQGLRSAVDRGLLWRISKGGRSSWLYGTLHVGRQPWMFPGPQVREALQSADRVALELDLLDPAVMGR
jgi:uncharacterized protein